MGLCILSSLQVPLSLHAKVHQPCKVPLNIYLVGQVRLPEMNQLLWSSVAWP